MATQVGQGHDRRDQVVQGKGRLSRTGGKACTGSSGAGWACRAAATGIGVKARGRKDDRAAPPCLAVPLGQGAADAQHHAGPEGRILFAGSAGPPARGGWPDGERKPPARNPSIAHRAVRWPATLAGIVRASVLQMPSTAFADRSRATRTPPTSVLWRISRPTTFSRIRPGLASQGRGRWSAQSGRSRRQPSAAGTSPDSARCPGQVAEPVDFEFVEPDSVAGEPVCRFRTLEDRRQGIRSMFPVTHVHRPCLRRAHRQSDPAAKIDAGAVTSPNGKSGSSRLATMHKKRPPTMRLGALEESGGVLLSHKGNPAVPSAQRGFTSVFGMGTGGSHALSPPKNVAGR